MAQFKNVKKRETFGSPGWKPVESLISWPHKVVIGSRMHRQPLIYWETAERGSWGWQWGHCTALVCNLQLYQPSAPWVDPKAKSNTFFKTCAYFSRVKHLLHPDLEKAAFHQQLIIFHKHDLHGFLSLQSTASSFKMKDATEIPTCHIFIILAMSISRLKAGKLISLLLLLLSFLRLF